MTHTIVNLLGQTQPGLIWPIERFDVTTDWLNQSLITIVIIVHYLPSGNLWLPRVPNKIVHSVLLIILHTRFDCVFCKGEIVAK